MGDIVKIHDMSFRLAKEIAGTLKISYHLSNYIILRKKCNVEEIFCDAGTDILDADNIVSYMRNKKDGYTYYFSEEVASFG
jgi:hypothetical protein